MKMLSYSIYGFLKESLEGVCKDNKKGLDGQQRSGIFVSPCGARVAMVTSECKKFFQVKGLCVN